ACRGRAGCSASLPGARQGSPVRAATLFPATPRWRRVGIGGSLAKLSHPPPGAAFPDGPRVSGPKPSAEGGLKSSLVPHRGRFPLAAPPGDANRRRTIPITALGGKWRCGGVRPAPAAVRRRVALARSSDVARLVDRGEEVVGHGAVARFQRVVGIAVA